jgi:hypothetical protein
VPKRNRAVTVERKDVTLPIGLAAKVLNKLGGRGLSSLVARLLELWYTDKTIQEMCKEDSK